MGYGKINMNKEISVIIPAYKEEENLSVILPQLNKTLRDLTASYEILIIDTIQAMDETKAICEANNVTYINRTGGNNYGDAIRTGIQHAVGNYCVFMDADGSHTPEFIANLYRERGGYDVVIASRYVKGGETDNSKTLAIMSLVLNVIYSVVLNLNCKDVSNSFKLYKTEDLQGLQLRCNNFDIVEEILFKLKKHKKTLRIKEIPFSFKKRMFGTTKRNLFKFITTYFFTLIKLRLS
jgi:dolichol-phosphate mannosyltransferase